MPDLIGNGSAWLAGQLAAFAGVLCAYRRGANVSEVTATIGRSEFQSANQMFGTLVARVQRFFNVERVEFLPFPL